EQVLRVARRTLLLRIRHKAGYAKPVRLRSNLDQFVEERAAQNLISPFLQRLGWRQANHVAAVVDQQKRERRIRQRVVLNKIGYVITLSRVALEKFSPRRNIEEQIAHFEFGAAGPRDVAYGYELAAVEFDFGAFIVVTGPGAQQESRNGGNRRQSLAAKAKRCDRFQLFRRPQLRSSVPLKGQNRVVARHAFAVIKHANELLAARFDFDVDRSRAGIKRVLEQFFDDG